MSEPWASGLPGLIHDNSQPPDDMSVRVLITEETAGQRGWATRSGSHSCSSKGRHRV